MGLMIQVREDLTRKPGDTVVFRTVLRLVCAGVTGNTISEGNEEILNARSLNLTVAAFRHAVAVSDWDEQKSVIDLREAAREALMVWELEKMRNDIITSLEAMTADGNVQVSYGAATAAQRNTWMVNNADRVLFGNSKSNAVSGVMATALLTIATPGGKMTAATVTLAKRIARTANPRIRPISVNDDEGMVWVLHAVAAVPRPHAGSDHHQHAAIRVGPWPRQSVVHRGRHSLQWRDHPGNSRRCSPLSSVPHGGGIDVAMSAFCGAQALGVAWAQRMKSTTNTRDYSYMHGVGIQEMRGIGKLRFGVDPTVDTTKPVDAGIVSVFTSAVADA